MTPPIDALSPFPVLASEANATLAAVLRARLPGKSWNKVRELIANRRAKVLGELCLDPARRVKEGDTIELLPRPAPRPRQPEMITIRYVDDHLVVVEKPSGLNSVRHPSELEWPAKRKDLSPTLHDLVPQLLAGPDGKPARGRLRIVHRLDKETSGLLVFARSVLAERALGKQFRVHSVLRRYIAIVSGDVTSQRVHSWLVRDRGDGRRGSIELRGVGKEAITHIEALERFNGYTLVGCRLETGRTHQIRIHLAELGHPVCGDRVYCHRRDGKVIVDQSGVQRLALHARELGFVHPVTGEELRWEMPLPLDLQRFVERLRRGH